ncbi:MAG: type II toxin-antitoxin system PemK/MazF family toxin [Actinomycetota bacterium]
MVRGDVYWINFEPALGGEIRKRRPAVIVSNNAANKVANRIQVVPLSTNVRRIGSWEARVSAAGRSHKAMADQIRTIARERVLDKYGSISGKDMAAVERAIKVQLGLS